MEKNFNKTKSIILAIILYIAIVFSVFPTMEQTYNLLTFYSNEMFQMIDMSTISISIRYIAPFISGLILYFLYKVYVKMILKGANGRMSPFNTKMDLISCRDIIDPWFILLCILLGIIGIIFNYFPYWSTLFQTVLRLVCALLVLTGAYLKMVKSLDKIFYPIVLDAFIWPAIIMVVLI